MFQKPFRSDTRLCERYRTAIDLSDGDSDHAFLILLHWAHSDDDLTEAIAALVRRIVLELWRLSVRHS